MTYVRFLCLKNLTCNASILFVNVESFAVVALLLYNIRLFFDAA